MSSAQVDLEVTSKTTLDEAEWNNSSIIKEDIAAEINSLKQQSGQDILVNGSADLVHTLIQHDVIDEYRLMIFPIVVGSGKDLFREASDTKALNLVGTKSFGSGVVNLTYEPAETE